MRIRALLLLTITSVGSTLPARAQTSSSAGAASTAARGDTLPLSLADAVRRADQLGEEVRIARANESTTGAQVTIARSAALPQLRINASENRTVASARGQAVGSVFNQPYTYSAALNAQQMLFSGGRVVNGLRAARAAQNSASATVAETRSEVNLATQTAYLNALFTARAVQIQQQSYDLATAQLRQAEQFEKAGRFSHYDVLRARVQVANIEPQLLQAEEDAQLALLELRRLTNIPASRPIVLTTVVDSTVIRAALANVDTVTGAANRPSVRAAEENARARQLGVSVARAALLPSVTFNLNSGYGAFPVNGDIFPPGRGVLEQVTCPPGSAAGRVCTQQNGGWFSDRSFGFTVSWPIFDGLATKGNIDLAGAQARVAQAQAAQTRETAFNDVARARADLTRAQAQFAAQRENVTEANEAYQLANLRYSRGLATQLEVSDAQFALVTAELNAARATSDIYIAIATLAQAQGRPLPLF